MRLSELGEFNLIKSLRTKYVYTSPEILKGIGDDAAALKLSVRTTLVTSDMMLEGIHFDPSFTTYYQLGYKILAINISDIFAMGGTPRYFLLNLGIPRTYNAGSVNELYSGLSRIARKFRIAVIGGDTCASRHGLVLSGLLIGDSDSIISRSGARDGDGVFVTDTMGDSAMGLMLLKRIGRKIPIKTQNCKSPMTNFKIGNSRFSFQEVFPLLKRHLMPDPRPLKNTSGVTSMIDVSDGLLMDLSHICDESKVGVVIYKDKIPISRGLANIAKDIGTDPFTFALKGGEDYVLLFTAPSDVKTKAFRIGEIVKKGRFLIDTRGRKIPFKPEGYKHFK